MDIFLVYEEGVSIRAKRMIGGDVQQWAKERSVYKCCLAAIAPLTSCSG
jgi:hypothetical protein